SHLMMKLLFEPFATIETSESDRSVLPILIPIWVMPVSNPNCRRSNWKKTARRSPALESQLVRVREMKPVLKCALSRKVQPVSGHKWESKGQDLEVWLPGKHISMRIHFDLHSEQKGLSCIHL